MSERLWNILLDSFWKIFLPGLKVTIPLTVISFSIALVIATAMAMVQFANIKGLRQIARFYIWIFRGTTAFRYHYGRRKDHPEGSGRQSERGVYPARSGYNAFLKKQADLQGAGSAGSFAIAISTP